MEVGSGEGGVVIQEVALQQYTITHSHQLVPTSSTAAYLRGSGPTISLLLCLSASGDLFLSNKQLHCSFCGVFFFMKNSKSLAKVALPTACWGSALLGYTRTGMGNIWIVLEKVLWVFIIELEAIYWILWPVPKKTSFKLTGSLYPYLLFFWASYWLFPT